MASEREEDEASGRQNITQNCNFFAGRGSSPHYEYPLDGRISGTRPAAGKAALINHVSITNEQHNENCKTPEVLVVVVVTSTRVVC